ncbi:hypothetical protein KGB53_gp58 [Klebsiella virus KpV2811]|jgi:hypothetical protein|nr:hypothetical protein KGB53_gp58 [Klebsiella virus KpV2811]QMP82024.1 hypothetical protein KpV2811_058 [Klebsiella virus KpV2811]
MCPLLMFKARNRYVRLVMRGMDEHAAWLNVMDELKSIYNGDKK